MWWFWYRQDQLEQIAKKLEGPLVVQKGAKDGISDGTTTIYCEGGGSKRRAGGQVCPASAPPLAPLQHCSIFCLISPFINSFQALLAPLPPVFCIEPLRQGHFHASVLPCSKNLPVEQLDACEVHIDSELCRSMLLDPDTCCCLCRVMS